MEGAGAGSGEDVFDKGEEEPEDEEEEEGDTDEFIDVLDVLGDRGEADIPDNVGEVERGRKDGCITRENEEIEGLEGSEENDEDEEPSAGLDPDEFSAEEDEADRYALNHLGSFIISLGAGTKRKASEDADSAEAAADDKRKRRRRLLKEQTQTGVESEFAAQTGVCVPHA